MGFGCSSKIMKTVGGWNVGLYLAASLIIDVIKNEVSGILRVALGPAQVPIHWKEYFAAV